MIHRREQTATALQHLRRHGGGLGEIAHLVVRIVGIPGFERFATPTQPHTATKFPGKGGIFRNRNIGGNQTGEAGFMCHNRAHGRVISEGRTKPPRQDPIRGRLMVIILVGAGTHEADFVHDLGDLWHKFADLEAWNRGGNAFVFPANLLHRLRLHIKAVVVRNPATEINQHHGFRPRFDGRLFGG